MQTQSIINKLPEVIKCIIFDYVSNKLNHEIELCSDKFIGNPIDMYNSHLLVKKFYHINKLTKFKTPLHFIGLYLYCYDLYDLYFPQKILNKLQKLSFICDDSDIDHDGSNYHIDEQNLPNLPSIKILNLYVYFTEIFNFKGLQELDCSECVNLTEIPHIIGLKKLNCSYCDDLVKIPHIIGLLELDCSYCVLFEIPHIIGLNKLHCSYCSNLTEIPHIVGLLELNCSGCNIIKIPHIIGLKKLYCNYCEKLTEIPNIKGLLELYCYGCDNIISIPHIIGLKILDHNGCEKLTEIPCIDGCTYMD